MIEAMIDEWKDATGGTRFIWSLWRGGKRVMQGEAHPSAEAAAEAAREVSRRRLGAEPDQVTYL
jgi:hypothetical protein